MSLHDCPVCGGTCRALQEPRPRWEWRDVWVVPILGVLAAIEGLETLARRWRRGGR